MNLDRKINLFDRINIDVGSGEIYNVSGFDIIIVSLGVLEQERVLKNIINFMNEDTKIIIRCKSLDVNNKMKIILENYIL